LCYRATLYGTNRELFESIVSPLHRAALLRAARGRTDGG